MNLTDFHFIRPDWLLALLLLIGIIFYALKHKLQQGNWQTVCDAELLPFILEQKQSKPSYIPITASSLAAFLVIIALAGPTWERLPSPVFRNAAALVIVLDLSRSMDAGDIKPSRLIRARYKIADLLAQRKDGQTALIVYAADAFTVTPLTDDTETINSQLTVTTDIMPSQGSNTARALDKAMELFKNAGLQKGQILLVTDDDEIELAEGSLSNSYALSILGVGTEAGAPIKLKEGGFLKDSQGAIVLPQLKEKTLGQFASAQGGIYLNISDNNADIEALTQHFEQAAKRSEAIENDLLLENWQEAGVWLLLPILILVSLSFRRGLLSLAFLILIPLPKNSYAVEWQDLWQTKNQQAQTHYQQGNYDKAAAQFTDPAWQAAAQYKTQQPNDIEMLAADSDTAFYNQGNVQAKAGQLKEAIESYQQALALNPNNDDAKHNQEVVEKALEEQEKQQQEQKDQDKKPSDDKKEGDQEKDSDKDSEKSDSDEQQDSEEQNSEESDEPKEAEESDAAQKNQPEQQEQKQDQEPAAQQANQQESTEQEQANEQWLNRIPDDPYGLLKRKFLYQYSQQKQPQKSKKQW
ncbi:MAG: VWA domain-containing protein [Methyloprofundus sp.]|nr:VWA domain-containing protein [Methyloprofundus sp.]